MIGSCGVDGCINAGTTAALFTAWLACWAGGFGIGKAVAYVRKIVDVA